ncbi:MAG: GNAT family N-acetyltransferase [Actinomycetota bacterium]
MTAGPTIRPLERHEIEPYIALLESEGFTPDVDRGMWLGGFVDDVLAGWIRVFHEGAWMIEDVYVLPAHRSEGLATTLLAEAQNGRDELWLICDDEMIGFYEARGYRFMEKEAFPEPLATLYRAKAEWPTGGDHNHNALRWQRG